MTHLVTPNFFDVLGVEPHLGRTFAQDEDKPGKNRVAVISYPLWQRVFGADPEAVGRKIQLDSEPYTLIGVLPRDFYSAHLFSTQPDLWVPLDLSPQSQDRRDRRLVVFGRLATGRTLGQAQASMSAIAATLAREHPETNRDWKIRVQTVHEDVVGDFRSTFVLLVSAVGFVLLIACANVASLVLTRASQRSREIAVRFALGARRRRVLRQILTENMILAGFGGTFGFVIAWWAVQPMARLIPSQAGVPFISDIRVDSDILAFTMILTLLSGIFFGLAPAWQASRWAGSRHDPA